MAAVEHAFDKGIVGLGLRESAAAIGTSHGMLMDHVGSQEGLLVSVVREAERRERTVPWPSAVSGVGGRRAGRAS